MLKLAKWVLVPLAVGAVGYYVVAPTYGDRITRRVQAKLPEVGKMLDSVRENVQPKPESGFKPPSVDVSVRGAVPEVPESRDRRGNRDRTELRSLPMDPGT